MCSLRKYEVAELALNVKPSTPAVAECPLATASELVVPQVAHTTATRHAAAAMKTQQSRMAFVFQIREIKWMRII